MYLVAPDSGAYHDTRGGDLCQVEDYSLEVAGLGLHLQRDP
jgi:hypothetical protein